MATGEPRYLPIVMADRTVGLIATQMILLALFHRDRSGEGSELLDVPAMPYHTLESLMEDPHLQDVGFFQTLEHPTEGKVRNMRLPNKTSFSPRRDFMGAPKLGQHSVEVLRDAGFDEEEIRALSASGAIIDGRLETAR